MATKKPNFRHVRLAIAASGVLVSLGLAAAAVMTMPADGRYGPGLSTASLAFVVAFFALNPAHLLLLLILARMRHLPLWIGSVLLLAADLAWWWLVSPLGGTRGATKPPRRGGRRLLGGRLPRAGDRVAPQCRDLVPALLKAVKRKR